VLPARISEIAVSRNEEGPPKVSLQRRVAYYVLRLEPNKKGKRQAQAVWAALYQMGDWSVNNNHWQVILRNVMWGATHFGNIMPHTTNYTPIIPLISSPRLSSYRAIFKPQNDGELYGTYVWAQHAAGSLYPLTQNAEITLRNAVDAGATKRFGPFWWRLDNFKKHGSEMFQRNMDSAEQKLSKVWEEKERRRLKLRKCDLLPTPMPVWRHEQIIAATDFSTWQFILHDCFSSKSQGTHKDYLWPHSMGDIFKKFSQLHNSPSLARKELINVIKEIRDYRNRLFHHESIWIKDPSVTDATTAINSIRKKINRIQMLITAIEPRMDEVLTKIGVFDCARRICTVTELDIYRYPVVEPKRSKRMYRIVSVLASVVGATTAAWSYRDGLYGIYKIR
jgi:hypothetical protein